MDDRLSTSGARRRRSFPIVVLALAAFAGSGGEAAAAKPKLRASFPAAVPAAKPLVVTGRVRGAGRVRKLRVRLEQRAGHGWRGRRQAKVHRNGRFRLVWRRSAPGTVTLRITLLRGKRRLARGQRQAVRFLRPAPAVQPPVIQPPVVAPPTGGGPAPQDPPEPGDPSAPVSVPAPDRVTAVPPPGQPGDVILSGDVDVEPGHFLALDIGPETPYGFLGRVTAVTRSQDRTIVTTSPTTLLDVFPQGGFAQQWTARELARAAGVRGRRLRYPLRGLTLTCTGGGSVVVEGELELEPSFDIAADWGFLSVDSAHAIVSATASAELEAEAHGKASCTIPKTKIKEIVLPSLTFTVGVVPVVVVPKITVTLEGGANAEADAEVEVHGSITATAGVTYADGEWDEVGGFDHQFGYTGPLVAGTAHAGAAVSTKAELLFYGVGGPRVTLDTGAALDAEAQGINPPCWKLTAPVSLTAMLAADVLKLKSPVLTVFDRIFELARADACGITWQGTLTIVDEIEQQRSFSGGYQGSRGSGHAVTTVVNTYRVPPTDPDGYSVLQVLDESITSTGTTEWSSLWCGGESGTSSFSGSATKIEDADVSAYFRWDRAPNRLAVERPQNYLGRRFQPPDVTVNEIAPEECGGVRTYTAPSANWAALFPPHLVTTAEADYRLPVSSDGETRVVKGTWTYTTTDADGSPLSFGDTGFSESMAGFGTGTETIRRTVTADLIGTFG